MKKKITAMLLICVIIITILILMISNVKAYTYKDNDTGLTWTYTLSNNEATNVYISSYVNSSCLKDIVIPSTMNGYKVTSIGYGYSTYSLIKTTYYASSVTSVTIPNTVRKINTYTFSGFSGLKLITIPDSVTTIGSNAFYNSGIIRIELPDSITSLSGSFNRCTSLTTVKFPNNIKELLNGTFSNCSMLEKIEIPETVTKLGEGVFENCARLKEVTLPNNIKEIPNNTFKGCSSLVNPNLSNINKIGNNAFYGCTGITELTISDSVNSLGTSAFENCYNIETINFGNGLNAIGSRAFRSCSKLKSLTLPNNITSISDNAFYSCYNITELTISDNMEQIGTSAFENCTKIATVNFGNGLKTIGSRAFYACVSLEKLNLPESLENIMDRAFFGCSNIKGDILIPNKVTEIGEYAFYNCYSATGTLTVGEGVSVFKTSTFEMCRFGKIILKSIKFEIKENAFDQSVTDIWIDQAKDEVNFIENKFQGRIHYKNCKHTINFEGINGVLIKDAATNEILTQKEFNCGEGSVEFYLDISDVANLDRDSIIIKFTTIKDGKEEITDKVIELKDYNGERYTFSNLLENKKVAIFNRSKKADLTLRTYIAEINDQVLAVDRTPVSTINNGKFIYAHTKVPVIVEKNDLITYKIRVYNEGMQSSKVNCITSYLPEGLDLEEYDIENLKYSWQVSEDGRKITTDFLKNEEIEGYDGNNTPAYKEIPVVLRVTHEKGIEDIRLVNNVEITSATEEDRDSNYGSIQGFVGNEYKKDEAANSNRKSCVRGQEDDDDFENIVLSKDIKVSYQLEIKKIDIDTKELLNGAEFELLDENENVLKSGETVTNGVIDFGVISKPGSGIDKYYIVESKTPEGYEKITRDKIELEVIRTIVDGETGEYSISVKSNMIETDRVETENVEFIPVTNKEELAKIGSNEEITIDGKKYIYSKDANYELKTDIDLSGSNWVPIQEFNGKFNGKDHVISNMTINIDSDISIKNIGLFGKLQGEVSNLNLKAVDISVENMTKDLIDNKAKDDEIKARLDSIHVGGIAGYFEAGTIRNCTVDGKISANSNSVGGLVGFSNGYMLISKNTNNADISGTNSNVGGLIGYANSSLSIISCTNNGQIEAGEYNAGGLIGCAKTGEYKQTNVNIAYINSKITIIIENKKITDQYSLVLENRDIETLGLLKQGRFTIYDVSKNARYENVVLEDGTLKIADIDIKNLGTDTYYIEQLEVQNDYNLNNRYVKLIVTKTWDGTTEEYNVSADYEVLTKEQFIEETAKDEEYSSSSSGKFFAGVDVDSEAGTYISMNPIIDTISVRSCSNTGKIVANNLNAAGILGKTTGNIDISNCTNAGSLTSTRTAGIIAEALSEEEKEDYLRVSNCINLGNVESFENEESNFNESGGIIGRTTVSKVKIVDSENNGHLFANTAAGILANAEGKNNIINNCKNKGEITSNAVDSNLSVVGGIIAKARNIEGSIVVTNCTNTANIYGGDISGILAYAEVDTIIIDKCESKNNELMPKNDYDMESGVSVAGGILSWANGNIKITNCNIENIEIKNNQKSGGIVGYVDISNTYYQDTDIVERKVLDNVIISKCNVKNLRTSNSYSAGIIAMMKGGNIPKDSNMLLCVVSCEVDNFTAENGCVAGGIGFAELQGTVIIKSCKLNSSNILEPDQNFGGMLSVSGDNKNVLIENCYVSDTNVTINTGKSNLGGIVGLLMYNNSLVISNSGLNNCEFDSVKTANNSGIIACSMGKYIRVDNISINNSKFCTDANMGGIAGFVQNNMDVSNININNSEISSHEKEYTLSSAGGIVAYHEKGYLNIDNVKINNMSKIEKIDAIHVGGVVGLNSGETLKITNCSFTSDNGNKTIMIGNTDVSGVVGYTDSSVIIEDVIANNIRMSSGMTMAGIICKSENVVTCKNVKVSDVDMQKISQLYAYDGSFGGGIMAVSKKSLEISGAEVNNITINTSKNSGGIIGQALGNEIEISNVIVKNANITLEGNSGYQCVGGIAGFYNGKLDDAIAENITITNAIDAGAIVGNNDYNAEISNCKAKDIIIISNTYNANLGGIVGITRGNVNNSNISNLEIYVKEGNQNNNTGGIVGVTSKTINNCNVNGFKVEVNSGYTTNLGGILGDADTDCEINDCNVKSVSMTVSSNGFAAHIGGILGVGRVQINRCTVDTLDIIGKLNSQNERVGGIAGIANRNLEDVTVINENLNIVSNIGHVGGVVGLINGTINNATVDTMNITATTRGYVGGIAGFSSESINNCKVAHGDINAITIDGYNGCVGGIVGMATKQISNSGTETINIITDTNGHVGGIVGISPDNIDTCSVINGTIKSSGTNTQMGGIIGQAINNSAELTNCEVRGSNLVNTGCYSGGIAGFGSCTIKKSKFIDSNISVEADSAYGIGGIVGHGTNGMNNYTYLSDCEVEGSTVKGKSAVGGIAGAVVPYINNCTIKTSEIEGISYVGGIIGYGGDLGTGSTTYKLLPITITDCTMNDLKIKAYQYFAEIIGYNSFGGDKDVITNTISTNCELINLNSIDNLMDDSTNSIEVLDTPVDSIINVE